MQPLQIRKEVMNKVNKPTLKVHTQANFIF